MKKIYLTVVMALAAVTMMAQQSETPLFFRHQGAYLQYLMDHPGALRVNPAATSPMKTTYVQKLDSVIGSDDFDWVRWKKVYEYPEQENHSSNDVVVTEIYHEWDGSKWEPVTKTMVTSDEAGGVVTSRETYNWIEGEWAPYSRIEYIYEECGSQKLLKEYLVSGFSAGEWEYVNRTVYDYDDQCHLTLQMDYNVLPATGEWEESRKTEYGYDGEGRLAYRTYATKRFDSWRENQTDTLTYNQDGQCVYLLSYYKGGFGPGANVWRLSNKYEFEYEDGALASEVLYYAGWNSSSLTMDSKTNYLFDANGNELLKTASLFNEVEWIVRDSYENSFDPSLEAASVWGLEDVWETTLAQGMGYVLEQPMPLVNKWQHCSIVSLRLDTEFTLYCSGFASVEENEAHDFVAVGSKNRLQVCCMTPCDVVVYDLTGRAVASRTQVTQCEFALTPGFYLVSNGDKVIKSIVR